ncbi:MAG: flippase activity-associated protein Agl23 [Methermicoccaceae archaeon]
MKRKGWVFVLVVVVALALRLYMLDARAVHHDEGVHAYFVFRLLAGTPYVYDPTYHGPFLYYTQALVFSQLGTSELSLRLLPAIFGAGCVGLIYPLRRYMGSTGALFTAILLALSPTMLYYSRFLRNDIYLAFFTLASLVLVLMMREAKPVKGYALAALLGTSVALMTCTKENAYVVLAILAISGLVGLACSGWQRGWSRSSVRGALLPSVIAAVSFIAVFLVMYSFFFSDVSQAMDAVPRAFEHWIHMHEIERLGGPWYFYLPILTIYELPILLFGLAGGIIALSKRSGLWVGVLVWALLSLAFYSYMQEKVPWLAVHIVLPLALLSGYWFEHFVGWLKGASERRKAVALVVLVLVMAGFCATSMLTNYTHVNASKGITFIQPSDRFASTMGAIEKLHAENPDLTVLVCAQHNDYWPIPWYVRGMNVGYSSTPPSSPDYDVVIVERALEHHIENENDYERVPFDLRLGKPMVALFKIRR